MLVVAGEAEEAEEAVAEEAVAEVVEEVVALEVEEVEVGASEEEEEVVDSEEEDIRCAVDRPHHFCFAAWSAAVVEVCLEQS